MAWVRDSVPGALVIGLVRVVAVLLALVYGLMVAESPRTGLAFGVDDVVCVLVVLVVAATDTDPRRRRWFCGVWLLWLVTTFRFMDGTDNCVSTLFGRSCGAPVSDLDPDSRLEVLGGGLVYGNLLLALALVGLSFVSAVSRCRVALKNGQMSPVAA